MWCFTRLANLVCVCHGPTGSRRTPGSMSWPLSDCSRRPKDSSIDRLGYASSSSVYGAAEHYPTSEVDLPAPMSPYGVTKLAAEHLCSLYHRNYGVPTVSLRYFTVFGPRQRPDMAMHRLIDSAINGSEFTMFGDGSQIRDFTYVGDIVEANIAAATAPAAVGGVFNIGGGSAANHARRCRSSHRSGRCSAQYHFR